MKWAINSMPVFALWLAGCELLHVERSAGTDDAQINITARYCLFEGPGELQYNCDINYWLDYWSRQNLVAWEERQQHMAELSDDISGQLKKILLSQAKDTPYQARLRAQGWAEQLFPTFTPATQQLFDALLLQPSQSILEFESALAILTRINGQQAKSVAEQKQQLEKQRMQIEQFLKIEASIIQAAEEK